jgi:hypothetical protein
MRYTVFHARNPTFQNWTTGNPAFPLGYEKVAVVECDTPEEAYHVTNHIWQDWTGNKEVVGLFVKSQVRSTSVGDVIVDGDGRKFYCQMAGWLELP